MLKLDPSPTIELKLIPKVRHFKAKSTHLPEVIKGDSLAKYDCSRLQAIKHAFKKTFFKKGFKRSLLGAYISINENRLWIWAT